MTVQGSTLAARWHAAWSGRDAARFAACCTVDVHYEDPLARTPLSGPDRLARHAMALWDAFPDDLGVFITAEVVEEGRFACVPWRISGTQRGNIDGLPASGRSLSMHGVHYVEHEHGLVRRARGFFDLYDAGLQLGLMPPRGGLGERALLALRGFGLRPRG